MDKLAVGRVKHDAGQQPVGAAICGDLRKEGSEPFGEIIRCHDAAHEIGFHKAWREEVFSRGFIGQRAVFVVCVEFQNLLRQLGIESAGIGRLGPIEHETEGECCLIVRANADRVGELGKPNGCLIGDELFEWLKRSHPCRRFWKIGLSQLRHQLQEPGGAIGALKARAVFRFEISKFALDVFSCEALPQSGDNRILVGCRRIGVEDAHK